MVGENMQAETGETGEGETAAGRGRAKERIGVVVSAATPKTVMVEVSRRVKNTQYGKYQDRQKKYAVHDLIGCVVGDHVRIRETRPMSKTKRWRVVEKLTKAGVPIPAEPAQ